MQHVDPEVSWDDPASTQPPGRAQRVDDPWRPGRIGAALFVVVALVVSSIWLWSVSVPGWIYLTGMVGLAGMFLVAVAWLVCIVARRVDRLGWYLVFVPLIGVAVVVLTWTEVPLRLRFELARSQFDAYAEQVLDEAEGVDHGDPESMTGDDPRWAVLNPDVPERLGSFELSRARVLPEGVVIFDRHGALFDDAGFAYLPDGELPAGDDSFEAPEFRSLGGGWYAFVSSW